MNRADFISEYDRVRKIAYDLACLQGQADVTGWPDDDMGVSFSPDEVFFYELVGDQYEAGRYYPAAIRVSWADIDDAAAATVRLQEKIAAKKAREGREREEQEREQYERLRNRFER